MSPMLCTASVVSHTTTGRPHYGGALAAPASREIQGVKTAGEGSVHFEGTPSRAGLHE